MPIQTYLLCSLQAAICYSILYWLTIFISTILLPRYNLNNFKQPQDAIIEDTKRQKCGLQYYLEHDSPSNELFTKLGQTGDKIADDLWPDLLKLITKKNIKSKQDIDPLEILMENVDSNPKFKRFIDAAATVPKWCNFDALHLAQRFHQRLSLPFAYILGICTLVGGFGCPEINKVLISSRYWANDNDAKSLKNTLNRLRETSVWLYSVMRDANALKPYGVGWKSILRVRLFHAKIRYQLSLKNKKGTDQQKQQMVPINQCHLIGTLLGFQYTPLVVLRTIFGIPITTDELERYTMLWRYIGFVLGCVEWEGGDADGDEKEKCVPLETFAMSRAWMSKVWDNLINPDINEGFNSTTLMLSEHVLKSIALSISEKAVGKMFSLNEQTIEAFFRAFLTEEYANMVKLASIHWSYELQIRVIIAFTRIIHIVTYQLCVNRFSALFFKYIWGKVMYHLNTEVLVKREKYHCRFAKYCDFVCK